MAEPGWQAEWETESTSSDVTKLSCPYTTAGASGLHGLIAATGILPITIAGGGGSGTEIVYCRANTSDISGYRKLETSNIQQSSIYAAVTVDEEDVTKDLEDFVTDLGEMEGKTLSGTMTIRHRARYFEIEPVDPPQFVKILGYVYHRTSGGTETLLGQFSRQISTAWTTYTESVTSLNRAFGTNERLVFKAKAEFRKQVGS